MSVGEAALTLTERIIGSIPIPGAHLIQSSLDILKIVMENARHQMSVE